jgi:hypothetical protein
VRNRVDYGSTLVRIHGQTIIEVDNDDSNTRMTTLILTTEESMDLLRLWRRNWRADRMDLEYAFSAALFDLQKSFPRLRAFEDSEFREAVKARLMEMRKQEKSLMPAPENDISKVSLVAVEVLNQVEHAIRDLIASTIERLTDQSSDTRVEVYDTVVRCLPEVLKGPKSPSTSS